MTIMECNGHINKYLINRRPYYKVRIVYLYVYMIKTEKLSSNMNHKKCFVAFANGNVNCRLFTWNKVPVGYNNIQDDN